MAVLTDQKLEMTPTELNFGTCNSAETVKLALKVYNNALVPQHIGFMDLPKVTVLEIAHNAYFGHPQRILTYAIHVIQSACIIS